VLYGFKLWVLELEAEYSTSDAGKALFSTKVHMQFPGLPAARPIIGFTNKYESSTF